VCEHNLEFGKKYLLKKEQLNFSCDDCGCNLSGRDLAVMYQGDYESEYGLIHLCNLLNPFPCFGCGRIVIAFNWYCSGVSLPSIFIKENVEVDIK